MKYNVSGAGLHPAESSDFGTTFPSGSVKFASGKTEVTITINVKGDTLVEDDESVGVYDEQFLLTATSADFVGRFFFLSPVVHGWERGSRTLQPGSPGLYRA